MQRIIIFLLTTFSICFAQTDWEYWEAAEPSYVEIKPDAPNKDEPKSLTSTLLSGTKFLYSFFISDLDGDNCPFYPTCSEFFIQAANKTNIFQSLLMFTDRFTRDMNLGKSTRQYIIFHNHLYDPVDNYLLDENKVSNIPVPIE